MKYHRRLIIDLLEQRRLFAGLDVRIFEDPRSSRSLESNSSPAIERVVFLDLNADGAQQASEPISISDLDGIARFRNLQSGSYLVRLLGSSKSQLQTTDTQPAPTGFWTGDVGALQPIAWNSDSVGWFASNQSLIQFDIEQSIRLSEIQLPGRILSVTSDLQNRGLALVAYPNNNTELIAFDLQLGQIQRWDPSSGETQGSSIHSTTAKELVSISENRFLRQSNPQGDSLEWIPPIEAWDQNPTLETKLSGIAPNAQIHTVGSQGILIAESLDQGTRISQFHYNGQSFELVAERSFNAFVRFSSASPDGKTIALQTNQGIEIVSIAPGLPTALILQNAAGPSTFDTSRGLLWSLSNANPSRLIGWTLTQGLRAFDVLLADAGNADQSARIQLSLGFKNDTLIGLRDGQIYRHALSLTNKTIAQVVDQAIEQVAIGIRNRSENNPPVLRSLPSVQATEDSPKSIQTSEWAQATSDSDGDFVHYILVSNGQRGSVSWSSNVGGIFTPNPNENGQDQIVVQAYDGRSWSTPQTVGIQIQAVNDAPQGLLYSGVLAIPENRPGYVLGSLSIIDPDANEVFDYTVSDSRFEISGSTLKVRDTALIPYQAPGWIDLILTARSRTNGDSIQRSERIFIIKDPTPFHNDANPADVDGDGFVTPLDPLIIINYINTKGSGPIKPPSEGEASNDFDVDGDGQVTPLDILLVINALNQSAAAEGEAPLRDSRPTAVPPPILPVLPGIRPQAAPLSDTDDPLGLRKSRR
jgi:hypothetical protein